VIHEISGQKIPLISAISPPSKMPDHAVCTMLKVITSAKTTNNLLKEFSMNLPAASCRVSVLIRPLYSPSPYPLPPGERVNEVTL